MRTLAKVWLLTTAVGMAAGCGDDSTGPSESSLVGTWRATKVELISVQDPAIKFDLVALGATVRLVLGSSKAYTLTLSVPGEPQEIVTGSWSSSGDVLTLTDESGDMQFDMTLSGNTLTLTGADGEFDFNDDDVDEPAHLNMVLVRE
jgi:hypothetical protein